MTTLAVWCCWSGCKGPNSIVRRAKRGGRRVAVAAPPPSSCRLVVCLPGNRCPPSPLPLAPAWCDPLPEPSALTMQPSPSKGISRRAGGEAGGAAAGGIAHGARAPHLNEQTRAAVQDQTPTRPAAAGKERTSRLRGMQPQKGERMHASVFIVATALRMPCNRRGERSVNQSHMHSPPRLHDGVGPMQRCGPRDLQTTRCCDNARVVELDAGLRKTLTLPRCMCAFVPPASPPAPSSPLLLCPLPPSLLIMSSGRGMGRNAQYGGGGTGNTKLEEAQRKVDDVKGVMHQNIRTTRQHKRQSIARNQQQHSGYHSTPNDWWLSLWGGSLSHRGFASPVSVCPVHSVFLALLSLFLSLSLSRYLSPQS